MGKVSQLGPRANNGVFAPNQRLSRPKVVGGDLSLKERCLIRPRKTNVDAAHDSSSDADSNPLFYGIVQKVGASGVKDLNWRSIDHVQRIAIIGERL
jgi:hypothetical protein